MGPGQVAHIVCTLAALRSCKHVQYVSLTGSESSLPSSVAQAALSLSRTCSRSTSFLRPLPLPTNYTPGHRSMYPRKKRWQFVDTLFVADLRQTGALSFLQEEMGTWEWMSRLPWLLIVDGASQQEALRDLTWRLDNKVLFLALGESGISFSEAYRTDATAPPVVTQLGAVNTSSLRLQEDQELAKNPWTRRLNLTGAILHCSVISYDKVIITSRAPNGSIQISGMSGDIFHALESSMNFRLQCRFPEVKSFGAAPKGVYNDGVLGDVFQGKADVAVTFFFHNVDRDKSFDFSLAIGVQWYSLLLKRSKYFLGSSTYTLEFTDSTWIVIVVMFMTSVFVLKVIMHGCSDRKYVTVAHCCIVNASLFCNMGAESIMSRSPSYRMWLITVMVAVIILHISYSSSLITLLTTDEMNLPFENLRGLYQARNEYTLSIEKGTYVEQVFKNEKEGLLADVYRDMIAEHPEYIEDSNSSLHRLLQNSKHAIYWPDLLPITVKLKACYCNGDILTYFRLPHYTIATQAIRVPRSLSVPSWTSNAANCERPVSADVTMHELMKMRSGGIIHRLKRKWKLDGKSSSCQQQPAVSLGLQETITAFYVLAMGVVLSTGILLVEWVVAQSSLYKTEHQASSA
ncbi:Ionotropic glutamate receptor L-glutamate and glycine-binding domain [Trinorchestia longiramus]|nr:Ionotropic glutamate receptor L-glutamate and glycine-binding domain [Trinorchestia longiramus]